MAFILLSLSAAFFAATMVLLWRSGVAEAVPEPRLACASRPGRPVTPGKNNPARNENEWPHSPIITIALVFADAGPAEPLFPPDGRPKGRFHPRF